MNIREKKKGNHRSAVAVHKALNEKDKSFEYFLPLLQEKKTSIVSNAINNLNYILTYQSDREEEVSKDIVDALCQLFTSGASSKLDKPEELGKCIGLVCLKTGDNNEYYRYIKSTLSSIISDGEVHIKDNELIAAIYALCQACFYCCTDRESYKHTISLFQDLLYTQKRKNIQDKLLSAWLLLLTRVNPQEMTDYKMVLPRLIEFSKSSSQNVRLSASLAIAMIVDDVKEKVLEDFESEMGSEDQNDEAYEDYDDEEDYDDDDYNYDEEEEIERDYRRSSDHGGKSAPVDELNNLSLNGENGEYNSEEDGEEGQYSEYSEEDTVNQFIVDDDHMIKVIEETLSLNDDKGKKKIQSKSLLRQILVNLKDGDSPKETIIINGLPFHFSGWRKYIQLEGLRKLVGSGMMAQWSNPLIQKQFGIEIPEGVRLREAKYQLKRSISQKKKTDYDRSVRSSSSLFENNAAN
ncbi:hypothetical protein RB653_008418 [Dictyostelium firmibasis]|uniref:Interferon-related developmental regulator N-terminal domain-containing protein n=1 Tax=Dictyostelium firmibasis TaxID=79012 RepID=A0AAN7U4Q4_9MYCE